MSSTAALPLFAIANGMLAGPYDDDVRPPTPKREETDRVRVRVGLRVEVIVRPPMYQESERRGDGGMQQRR